MPVKYSDDELLQLGITRIENYRRGRDAYEFKCASCGRPVILLSLFLDRPKYCNLCRTDALVKIKAARKEAERKELEINSLDAADAVKKKRFENAAGIMRKLGGYDSAIQKAEKAYEKYGSVPEAVAAIVLLQTGQRVIAQQPVSDFRVDFLLPDVNLVVEIDGALFHKDESKREMRDLCIRYNLGRGWDIIHVPAEALVKRPKVFERLMRKKIASR